MTQTGYLKLVAVYVVILLLEGQYTSALLLVAVHLLGEQS